MSDGTPIIIKKKKVHGGHGHHGGSWKVAYADFVTAMMAFFMVMWIMGMSEDTKAQIQGYFNDPFGFIKNQPNADKIFSMKGVPSSPPGQASSRGTDLTSTDESELRDLERRVKSEMGGIPSLQDLMKYIDVQVTDEGLRIEFVEAKGAVFFDSGQATIRPKAMQLIAKIAPVLAKSGRRLIIEGHTDAKPYASLYYTNLDLSIDRARAMRLALSKNGVPLTQFQAIRGLGDTQLRNPNEPYDFSNRRVTVLLPTKKAAPVTDGLPGDVLKQQIQGVFRRDLIVAPAK